MRTKTAEDHSLVTCMLFYAPSQSLSTRNEGIKSRQQFVNLEVSANVLRKRSCAANALQPDTAPGHDLTLRQRYHARVSPAFLAIRTREDQIKKVCKWRCLDTREITHCSNAMNCHALHDRFCFAFCGVGARDACTEIFATIARGRTSASPFVVFLNSTTG